MEDFRVYLEEVRQAPKLQGTYHNYVETDVSDRHPRAENNPKNPLDQSPPRRNPESDRRTLQPPRRQNLRGILPSRLPRKKITYRLYLYQGHDGGARCRSITHY